MLGIKRRPPALQPDDRKRLRMVRAEPAVGRGRRTSVSTSSFQDASINWRAASQVGVLHKKPNTKGRSIPESTSDCSDENLRRIR